MDYLKEYHNVESISVWGRSMGASTCLLYENHSNDIAALALDSPFANLPAMCEYHAHKMILIPAFLTRYLLSFIRKTIQKKAHFDIFDVNPHKSAANFKIPSYFFAAKNDELVPLQHSYSVYQEYGGLKHF
jgi:pimeloyl-ACP methyl ester carboxylesterase